MHVEVIWYKNQGKYYSDGRVNLLTDDFYTAVMLFEALLRENTRPGLVDGPKDEFHAHCTFYTEHGPISHLFVTQ